MANLAHWNVSSVFGSSALIFAWVSGVNGVLPGTSRMALRKAKACSAGIEESSEVDDADDDVVKAEVDFDIYGSEVRRCEVAR